MIIVGKNPVKEALKSETTITKLYIQKGIHDMENVVALAKERKIRIDFTDKNYLDKMSEFGKHQGLIAIAEEFKYSSLEEIRQSAVDKNESLFVLILDGVEDPHNLGSILRVAECSGVHGVIIPKHRACTVTETAVKVSAGASNYVKVCMVTNINDTIRQLSDEFVSIYCADMEGTNMYDLHLTDDIAMIIGGEGNGVKPLTRKLCDGVASISMYGKINSLNASVACGIMAYEVVRQRYFK